MAAQRRRAVGGPDRSTHDTPIYIAPECDISPRCSEVRKCPRCGDEKPLAEFARDRSKASGRKSHCRSCDRAKAKSYYERNRERVKARVNGRNATLRAGRGEAGDG